MPIRSKVPLRISFCGGGTDISPYPQEKGGVVLSATINLTKDTQLLGSSRG